MRQSNTSTEEASCDRDRQTDRQTDRGGSSNKRELLLDFEWEIQCGAEHIYYGHLIVKMKVIHTMSIYAMIRGSRCIRKRRVVAGGQCQL